jgi:heptosyltransferase-2
MTTPAVRAIRKAFPAAHITMLAKPWVMPVFEESLHLDDLLVLDVNGRHHGLTGLFRLARDLKSGDFDAAILLQNAFEAALVTWLAGIPRRIGFDTDGRRLFLTDPVRCTPEIKKMHQTGYYLQILRGVGMSAADQRLHLAIGPRRRLGAEKILNDYNVGERDCLVGINPSATFGPAKQWLPDRFAELADRLSETMNATVLIFGGPDDRMLGADISRMMTNRAVDLSGRTTLGEAIALIERCRVFVTNDSGLMHVAAALDVPLVAVFGSTNSATTSPYSTRNRIVRTAIECSPCMKPVCPLGHMDCMRGVTVDRVYQAVRDLL